MSGVEMVSVVDADDGLRVDRWFRQHYPQLRHGALEKMLRKGQIRVDGGRVKASRRVETGETIRVPPIEDASVGETKPKPATGLSADDKNLIRSLVIYEDAHIIAINKPAGLAVQGGTNTTRHIDGMLGALSQKQERPRLVHRLDRDTGGVLLLGRTRKSAKILGEAFARQQIEKTYWALCFKVPRPPQGTVKMAIAKKMIRKQEGDYEIVAPADGEQGKKAVTDFQLVEDAGGKASFVAFRPRTGRTHQIRVHAAAIGHPIIGDGKYGGTDARLDGVSSMMHLFCRQMIVPNPAGGKPISILAPLADHMAETWKFFSFDKVADLDWPDTD
ncbi:MAG: RluA family pseudouridine synthase [Parvularculaceae bacterium]